MIATWGYEGNFGGLNLCAISMRNRFAGLAEKCTDDGERNANEGQENNNDEHNRPWQGCTFRDAFDGAAIRERVTEVTRQGKSNNRLRKSARNNKHKDMEEPAHETRKADNKGIHNNRKTDVVPNKKCGLGMASDGCDNNKDNHKDMGMTNKIRTPVDKKSRRVRRGSPGRQAEPRVLAGSSEGGLDRVADLYEHP